VYFVPSDDPLRTIAEYVQEEKQFPFRKWKPRLSHAVFLSYVSKAAPNVVALVLLPRPLHFILHMNSEKNSKRLPTYFLSKCVNQFPGGIEHLKREYLCGFHDRSAFCGSVQFSGHNFVVSPTCLYKSFVKCNDNWQGVRSLCQIQNDPWIHFISWYIQNVAHI